MHKACGNTIYPFPSIRLGLYDHCAICLLYLCLCYIYCLGTYTNSIYKPVLNRKYTRHSLDQILFIQELLASQRALRAVCEYNWGLARSFRLRTVGYLLVFAYSVESSFDFKVNKSASPRTLAHSVYSAEKTLSLSPSSV